MINMDAAKSASMSVTKIGGANITNALPMVPTMVKTEIQNTGVYDLIFQYLHQDYPTRVEVDMLIKQLIISHHLTNWHLPVGMSNTPSPGSPLGIPGQTTQPLVPVIPRETMIKSVLVRAGSPVNSVGYGI